MKVLVVTEYYPRAADPVNGIWTHRQTVAARDAGVDVRVLVLHRPLPPISALKRWDAGQIRAPLRQPGAAQIEGIDVDYVRYLSPPRPWSYSSWGRWAAPRLRPTLETVRQDFEFDLVHAHYAVPAGDAVRRADPRARLVVSVHGHDVYGELASAANVRATLAHADLVLANSAGTAERSRACGARETRIVHLATDVPAQPAAPPAEPTLITVAHLAARKRHADVLAAVARLKPHHPELRYVIVGDGPQRTTLHALARSLGIDAAVEFRGRLSHHEALSAARDATLFVMPSFDEAFGVAYVEAMAAGVPAIGCRSEDGPHEIARAGDGIVLVDRGDVEELASAIDTALRDRQRYAALRVAARETVQREFTWARCGAQTLAAYGEALGA